MRRAFPRLILLLAALALLAAACGDDASPFASTSTSEGTGTTADDGSSGTTAGNDDTTPGGDEGLPEILERYRQVPLRTTYLTGDGADGDEITFSQDPTRTPPVSALITADGKMIFLEDRIVFCSGEGAAAMCFEMPAEEGTDFAGAMFAPFALFALAPAELANAPGFDVETGSVTIAGRSGICFTYRPPMAQTGDTEFVRQCVDDELGFTLLLEEKGVDDAAPERVMELVAVGDPQAEDFEPTGPVTPMPTG